MQINGGKNPDGGAPYAWQRGTCLTIIAIYPLLHVAAVLIGLFLSSGTHTATLWTSNALLLAVMVMLGRRWWLPLLGSLIIAEAFTVAFLTSHLPLSVSMTFSAANMLEGLIAALLWPRLVNDRINIFRLRDCFLLIFVVATVAPAISGLLAGLSQNGLGDAAAFFRFWQLWWSANALGIILISTVILAWAGATRGDWDLSAYRQLELVALILSVLGLTQLVFSSDPGSINTVLGLPYVVFPLLVWSSVRFGTRISVTLVLLIAVISIINTDGGNGPYSVSSYTVYQRVLSLQMFLVAAAILALILGAAFAERGVALQFLQASEDKFSKAFHASPDAICICRLSDGCVMDVNTGFHTMTGYARMDTIGSTLQSLGLSPLEEQRCKFLEPHSKKKPVKHVNSIVTTKTGSTKEIEAAYDFAEIDGALCMVCVLHDMTSIRAEEEKRNALEVELMQAKKMEAIGQLTGGIAHDFNNILFGVLGNTELAESRASGLDDSALTAYLGEIRRGSTRARDLVAQLLAFGRSEPTNLQPLDVVELIDEVLGSLKQLLPTSLVVNTPADTQAIKVLADPVQLQRAIMNLCINARDATDGDGVIDIEVDVVRQIRDSCSSCGKPFAGDFACLSIRDSGPGIGAEVLPKVFEPFYTSKDVGKGTGLGLSIVHGVVHGHGGHIIVNSTPGKMTVSSYIPLAPLGDSELHGEEADAPEVASTPFLKGRVLLVDDEDSVRRVLRRILERWGLDVTAVMSGAVAFSMFEADPQGFDVVITDQTMPHMTGVSLARKMLAVRSKLPVILCSGYSGDIDARRASELGIRGYIQKPVDFSKLAAMIEEMLETKTPAST